MSSTETSAAPAEGNATVPAPESSTPVSASTFGTSRGSGLARGKRPASSSPSTATAAAAASAGYVPTAIEIVTAPREYKNPFAPAEPIAPPAEPAAATPEPAPTPPVSVPAVQTEPAASDGNSAPVAPAEESSAELNILPPERPKNVAPQTWEHDGFRGSREPRGDRNAGERPRREDRFGNRRDGARPDQRGPREPLRHELPENRTEPRVSAEAPQKSGGFFGWVKSLFGGEAPAPSGAAEPSRPPEGREPGHYRGGRRRHRGGERGGYRGEQRGGERTQHGGGEHRSQGDGFGERREGDHRRRRRGGRGRGGFRGEHRGGDSGGPAAT